MKKNVLVRSRTFWIVLERSFEICVYVCKQGEFRSFLIVWNVLFHCYLQTFQGQSIGNHLERTRTFWNVPERSGTFQNVPYPVFLTGTISEQKWIVQIMGTFQNVPERSRTFTKNVLERTRSFVFKIACDDTYVQLSRNLISYEQRIPF